MSDAPTPAPAEDAAAAAKAAHDARVAELAAGHAATIAKLDELKTALAASLAKAGADPGHADYTASFQRDVGLKADEIVAWIGRHA